MASSLEIHADAIGEGERVLLVDDLIATGGTADAATILPRQRPARWSTGHCS